MGRLGRWAAAGLLLAAPAGRALAADAPEGESSSPAAGVVALLVLVALADEPIRHEVQAHRKPSWDRWEKRIQPLGKSRNLALAGILTWGAGSLLRDQETTATGKDLLRALLLAEGLQLAGKAALGREPPGAEADPYHLWSGRGSFPSGHAARAFAVAAVLAERHGRPAAAIAYPLAVLVGLARVERDVHWTSDVVAGALLGHAVGRFVTSRSGYLPPMLPKVEPSVFLDPDGRPAVGVVFRVGGQPAGSRRRIIRDRSSRGGSP
jgi:membrane-associated phospholipid phosphatase